MSHEIGILVRSQDELDRAVQTVEKVGIRCNRLDNDLEVRPDYISASTMHLAKEMKFRAVSVTACEDEVIPSQLRVKTVTNETDITEVYETERHLLYLPCTRARDYLLVTCGDLPSEFIEDLHPKEAV